MSHTRIQTPLYQRYLEAHRVLEHDTERGLALVLDVYVDSHGTAEHDVADGAGITLEMNASRFVLELIAKRCEVTKDPDLLGWLDVLEAAVRPGLKRRPWKVIEGAKVSAKGK